MNKLDYIIIKGARENNLKNISVKIPKKKITVFTGVSGSGKSSLVFDTIAAESQRLLNETYNSFIRNRLQQAGKPDVDSIENLSVSMVINQNPIYGNARSTVGTITDIYSLLRLLFSRVGLPFVGHANAFSFNNLQGMCPDCEGLGISNTIDFDELINKEKSLNEGAIKYPSFEVGGWRWTRYVYSGLFDNDKKIKDYTEDEWYNLVYADNIKLKNPDPRFPKSANYEGILARFQRSFLKRESSETKGNKAKRFKEIVKQTECPACKGARLNQLILSNKIQGVNIAECCNMQIDDLLSFIKQIKEPSVSTVLDSIKERLENMISIGLDYLNLNRITTTLSGGESQRVKLIKHLGSSLTDLTYIFDEPSVGLHSSDVHKLNKLLIELCKKGNTVLIVEHDPDVIAIADNVIDMGIGAGKNGGEIIFEGDLNGLKQADTPTGKHLQHKLRLKSKYRHANGFIKLESITRNNLENLSANIPKEVLTVLTGVAGSGKSSLIQGLLKQHKNVLFINQSRLKGTKRSNAATYTGIMDEIRRLFAKENKVKQSMFSSNSEGGCKECKGLGKITTDLAFMDSIETTCDACNGNGYKMEILKYKYKWNNIVEILNKTVDESVLFFDSQSIISVLEKMQKVGLGYLSLGQTLDTLSGGECQRLKLATELNNKQQIYIFDEPTTGLHGSDTTKLLSLFNSLVNNGNTVIIIEHNMDIISQADWIIDMGPGAGKKGGKIIFEGFPNQLLNDSTSLTGKYLKIYSN